MILLEKQTGEAAPAAWNAPPEAHAEAARIRTLCTTAQTIAQLIEAQVMESLWNIRRLIPEEESWGQFVERNTPLDRGRAARMVQTWEVARKRRELRELAQKGPTTAMALIGEAIEAGVNLEDVADREVASILAQPARRRHGAIRALVEEAAARGESPAAAERVRAAEAERDEAVAALEEERKLASHPASRHGALVHALETAERELAELAMDAAVVLDDDRAPETLRARVLALVDSAHENLDRIAGAVHESDEAP